MSKLQIIVMKADGDKVEVKEFDQAPTLKQMQEMVGGYIELVPMKKKNEFMVVNEDGRPHGLPQNNLASAYLAINAPEYARACGGIVGNAFLIDKNLVE